MKPKNIVIVLFCHFSAVRIGYVETSFSVCETEPDIVLEIQLLEGTIAPKCGNIVVTVSTSDQTALGWLSNNTLCTHSTYPVIWTIMLDG